MLGNSDHDWGAMLTSSGMFSRPDQLRGRGHGGRGRGDGDNHGNPTPTPTPTPPGQNPNGTPVPSTIPPGLTPALLQGLGIGGMQAPAGPVNPLMAQWLQQLGLGGV